MKDVYWWSKARFEDSKLENFGDALVPYLLQNTTSEDFQWVRPNTNTTFKIFKRKHYLIIGSIISAATTHSIIWGAGIMHSKEKVKKGKFLAVRGPKTRERLLELGYKVPEVYGDPAVLLALFFKQKPETIKYEYGIVPHFVDYDNVKAQYSNQTNIKIINLITDNVEDVINQFLQCEHILSSSLHGLIVAHTFRIPALWTKISDKLAGDDIKFEDYFSSIGLKTSKPIEFKPYDSCELKSIFETHKASSLPTIHFLNKIIKDLTRTFPFQKTKRFKLLIRSYFENHA
ncbi:polysaccharide pyruvyl transferase family protein [Winogradskyella schleiferi]|uniref:polysaccharide pyruvyl transferase family protein n=1 Tax=Winogradskyella schleiferi TaxID=2686078 RepID=UPI0015BD48D4|nr:polysaccharide pyruvyl transferase family protein [Winogradskyella schleiferi]